MHASTVRLGSSLYRHGFISKHHRNKSFTSSVPNIASHGMRSAKLAKAGVDDEWPAPSSYKLYPSEVSISGGIYNFVQGSELLFYAALADAGFSGDWSRIDVLTKDQEILAQQAWWFILVAHSVVAAITLGYALRQGYPPLQAAARGLLFGTLGLYDVYVRCEAKKAQRSNLESSEGV